MPKGEHVLAKNLELFVVVKNKTELFDYHSSKHFDTETYLGLNIINTKFQLRFSNPQSPFTKTSCMPFY